jgi:hypothetical protein
MSDESSVSEESGSVGDDLESDMTSDLAPADFIGSINKIRKVEESYNVLSVATSERPCAASRTEVPRHQLAQ